MKVESIAECSPWIILQYFWPAISDNWSWKPIIGLFKSGRFTQVLFLSKNIKVERKTNIRNRYYQVPYLTNNTKTQENTIHERYKSSALSQQVIAFMQGTDKTAR